MVGLEALSMQGLPVEKLLLTRESEDQLADLAGNAMSTTVVGACILAALICGRKLLKAGDDTETYEMKDGQTEDEDAMDVDKSAEAPVSRTEIVGEDKLEKKTLDLSSTHACNLTNLLVHAQETSRLCACEGRNDMTKRELFRCEDCGRSFCKKCGGRPEHNPTPCTEKRVHPAQFAQEIKSILPMSLQLAGIDEELFSSLREGEGQGIKQSLWLPWKDSIVRTTQSELR